MENYKDTPDGPTAFPIDRPGYSTLGMTLRDYFAAAALNGYLSTSFETEGIKNRSDWAVKSYAMADAMLTERAKNG